MKKWVVLILSLLLIFSLCLPVFAEGGDGSGGGKDIAFALDTSSIPDGSTNVKTDEDIILNFNKNVVNFTVKENNMKCFSMKDSKGNNIPLTVLMGDDQVDHEIRRIITIHPEKLVEGETYTLTISKNLQAKNGSYLGEDVHITFSTVKPAVTSTPAPTVTPKPTATATPTSTANPTATVTPSPSKTSQPSPSDTTSPKVSKDPKEDKETDGTTAAVSSKKEQKEKKRSSLVIDEANGEESMDVTPSRSHHQPVAIYIILGIFLVALLIYLFVTRNNNKKE